MNTEQVNVGVKEFNDSIIYDIGRVYILLDQYFSGIYSVFGLSPAKYNVLMVIKHIGKDKGVSQNEIGDNLFVSAANITKLIDALEQKKLVQRLSSQEDRRIKLIKITEKGTKLLDKVWMRHVDALNSILTNFSQQEKQMFYEFLGRLKKEMEEK